MTKLRALFRVFQVGQSVADPVLWKNRQITGAMLASLMGACVALAKAFGYELAVSDADLVSVGSAAVIVWGLASGGLTVATTDKIGLPGPAQPDVQPPVPALPEQPKPSVSPVRHAANGDPIDDTQRRE